MHHSEALPSFIHLGSTSKLRKRLQSTNAKSNTDASIDSAHSPRLTATTFATTSSTKPNDPQSSVNEATYILKHVSIRDRHPPLKRRGRPISRVRGKHGHGKIFNPQRYDNSEDRTAAGRDKKEARSLHLQTYIHNRRLRLRQRLLHPQDQHSDDGSEHASEMDDIVFAADEQFQRNLWEVEQKLQERTKSAAKSRSHFLMERRISAGEKADRAQLVVQRQRTALEKRQLKVRHDLEQKMMQAMERRNAYLEAAIENDPSRRFRRKSQTNKDHETKKENSSIDSDKDAPSRVVTGPTPGSTASALTKRSPLAPRSAASSAAFLTRLLPHNGDNNNKNNNSTAKNSSVNMTNTNKTTTAHLTSNPPIKTTSSPAHSDMFIPMDSNRSIKDAPMEVEGGDNNSNSGHGQHQPSSSSVSPLKLEEMAIWAQRRIRERLIVKAAQEYMQAIGGSHDRVLALDFDPLARLLHTNKTLIQATLKLLKYSSQQVRMHHPALPKRVYKAPARVFLSMYMVLAHPDQIQSPSESLATSAKTLIETFELWVATATFLHGDELRRAEVVHKFDEAWTAYYSMFEAWKARDAQRLLDTLLNHAQHIEALWVTVHSDPTARLEWQPRIEEQRRDLREKAEQLAGAEGVAQLDAVFSNVMAIHSPVAPPPPHHIMGPPPGSLALPRASCVATEATSIKRPRKKSAIAREAAEALELTSENAKKAPRQRKKKVATDRDTENADKTDKVETVSKVKKPRPNKNPEVDDNADQAELKANDTPDQEEAPKVKKPRAKKPNAVNPDIETDPKDDMQDQTEEAPKVANKSRARKPKVDALDQTEMIPNSDDTSDQTEETPKVKTPRAKKAPKTGNSDSQETPKADEEAGQEEAPKFKKPRVKKAPKVNPDTETHPKDDTPDQTEETHKVTKKLRAKKPKADNPDETAQETAPMASEGEVEQAAEDFKVAKKPRAKKVAKPDQETVSMVTDGETNQAEEVPKAIKKPRVKKVPKPDQETVTAATDGETDQAEEAPKAIKKPRAKKATIPDQETVTVTTDGEDQDEVSKVVKRRRTKNPKTDDTDAEIPMATDEPDQEEAPKVTRKPRAKKVPQDENLDTEVPNADGPDEEDDPKEASEKKNWRGGPKYETFDKISLINFQNVEDKDSTDPVPGFEKPADWTKVKLIHELALDPNFKIESNRPEGSGDEDSFEARIRVIATKAYFDSIREDAAQGQLGKWIPSILTRIREQLLEMVPPKSAIAMQMNEAFDLEFVQQQVDRNVYDVQGAIKTVLEMMSKLCAPVRDERLQKIQQNLGQVSSVSAASEPLRFSSESGNDLVSVLQDVLALLDDMLMDLANFRLMAARPSLEKQAIPYEQKAFRQALVNKEVTMDNVRVWLQKAADAETATLGAASGSGSGSVQSPSSPAPASSAPATWTAAFTPTKMLFNRHFAVFARAMFNLLFSAELIDMQENFPETFNLDRDRLVKYQNEIQALVLVAVLIQIGQTSAPPLQEKEQVELKDSLLALMEKADTSIETLANCVIEAKENAILARQSPGGSGPLLAQEQKETLRSLINSAVEMESPLFKIIWKRMRAVLESYTVAPRYTIAMPSKEELTKVGLNALSSEIDKLADSIRFLAKYNANVYHEWYDPMLSEMLRPPPVRSTPSLATRLDKRIQGSVHRVHVFWRDFTDVEELEMCNLCCKEITALDEMTVHLLKHILQRDMVAFKNGGSSGQMMGHIDNEHNHDHYGASITSDQGGARATKSSTTRPVSEHWYSSCHQAFGRGAELRSHTLQHIEQAMADLSRRVEEEIKRVRMAKVKADLMRATRCAIISEPILKFLEPSENCEDEEEGEEEKVLLRIKRA
ncbi:hypothetical protein CPC16_003289 [Podila verticillata]|nr:hypothetical protein CPC16_003289 [Podila verticillata]